MKKSAMSLLAVAGCAFGLSCSAMAQWTPSGSPFAGPYTVVGTGTFFQSIDLNGASAPAGTYGKATVTADWAFVTGSSTSTLLWQNDSRMALTNAAVDGVAAVPGGVTIHFGGTGGAAPTTATGNQNPGTVRYDNVNLSTFYTGGNPLFLAFRSNFATGGNFTWSNINVTLTPPPAPPVNETCATAIDLSSGANAALTGVNTNFAGPAQEIGGANSATLAPSPFSCQATVSRATWYKFTPTTSASYVVGSCTTTGQATQNNMANNVVAIFDGSAGCGSLTSLACSTTTCTGGVQTGATSLTAGTDYYIAVARTGTTALGAAEVRSQIFIGRPDAAVCGSNTETEPNDTRATANSFTLNVGDTICGTTTGTSASGGGLATYDFYKIKTPANAGIKRNRIRVASFPAGHTLSLRGFGSTAGVINTTESEIQASSTSSSPARMIQWYTLGNGTDANDREITLRVGGTTSTTGQYSLNYVASDDVTPINLSRDIRPGSVTITTVGQTGATQGDTDMWMYDSNYNPIPGFGNDDTFNSASTGSTVTRTMDAGTYYLAITRYNLANNQGSPADDDFRTGAMFDAPGLLARGTSFTTFTPPASVGVKFTDSEGDVTQAINLTEGYEIAFVKVVVASVVTPAGCNPADIACDDGTPLSAAPGCTNSTTGPNEGDYNAFFAADGFFFQAGQGAAAIGGTCDIACDDGTELAGAPGCTNNGVNEGDYNCFFNNLFLPCL